MTAIQKEADEIISLMRRSRMDRIREELESLMKTRERSRDDEESAHKHGKVDECTMWDKELGVWITPPKYVEVISHSLVDVDREQVVLPSDRTFEVPLFDGVTLKECLQDSPNLKSKKFAQRRKKR